MTDKGNESKKEVLEPENVDANGVADAPVSPFAGRVLIPEYRIEKALRYYLKQPLTKDYVGMVHQTIDFLANHFLQQLAIHSMHTFEMRNTWLTEANRKPKTRMDIGVLSDLYYEIGEPDREKLDGMEGLFRELVASIGFMKAVQEVQQIMFANIAYPKA